MPVYSSRCMEVTEDMVAAFEVYPFPSHDKSLELEKCAFPDHKRLLESWKKALFQTTRDCWRDVRASCCRSSLLTV